MKISFSFGRLFIEMMMNYFRNFFFIANIFVALIKSGDSTINGQILAFIDINADCFTDLVVNTSSNSIAVYVASDTKPTFDEDPRFRVKFRPDGGRILNVGVGDFNGDSFPDLAVSLAVPMERKDCDDAHIVTICYATRESDFECHNLSTGGAPLVVCEHPLVMDCDLDKNSDLLTTILDDGKLTFACYRLLHNGSGLAERVDSLVLPQGLTPAAAPASNAFVDISGDLNPEIILWTEPSTGHLIDFRVLRVSEGKKWIVDDGLMKSPRVPDRPKLLPVASSSEPSWIFGQSVYDDFNKDGKIDHLLPFCRADGNGECTTLLLYVWIGEIWNFLSISLVDDKRQQWAVADESWGVGSHSHDLRTFHVRSGDYTQDGYPDLLVVLKHGDKRSAFLLENVDCPAGEDCDAWRRTFRIWWNPFRSGLDESYSVTTATFFDLTEDGTLDVLLEYRNDSRSEKAVIDFSRSVFEGDTTFLKVQVFTATCLGNCRYGKEGSAISLPGAALVYTSSDTDGNPIRGAYTQRSVTGYKPLLLPFALFGLGRTPNFVEKLQVGAPSWFLRNQSWEQLVPNSRIYVIPHPIDDPRHWLHRLYITPTRLIVYSAISLSSVCGLIVIFICGLHMYERRVDKKERELQRERFHFDAM